MELDEVKITLGPYIFGIFLAFIVLLLEHAHNINEKLNMLNDMLKNQDSLDSYQTKEMDDIPVVHFPEYRAPAPPIYGINSKGVAYDRVKAFKNY